MTKLHVPIQNLLKNNRKKIRYNCSNIAALFDGGIPTPAYHYTIIQETLQDLFVFTEFPRIFWPINVNAILCFPKGLSFSEQESIHATP